MKFIFMKGVQGFSSCVEKIRIGGCNDSITVKFFYNPNYVAKVRSLVGMLGVERHSELCMCKGYVNKLGVIGGV